MRRSRAPRAEAHSRSSMASSAKAKAAPASLRCSARAHGGARLVSFPVLDSQRQLVHLECPLRLQLEAQGPFETAARWLPLALRGRLTAAIDERAVELALAEIERDGHARCVNVSTASLLDSAFVARARTLLM